MTADRREQIANLFRDAGAAHHRAFIATNGDDPEWPRWYAAFLHVPLGALLGRRLAPESLGADLVAVDAEHRRQPDRPDWPRYYADWFLARYPARDMA